jgi:hypothetical protein
MNDLNPGDPRLVEWELRGRRPIATLRNNFKEWVIIDDQNRRWTCSGSTKEVVMQKAQQKGIKVVSIDRLA